MASEAGDIVNPVFSNIVTNGVEGSQNIAKGNVVAMDVTDGRAQVAASTDNRSTGFGVAREAADNSSGSDGDIAVTMAIAPSEVYVIADGAIQPFNFVKVASTAGQVVALTTATEVETKLVGQYLGHEGEKKPTAAADGDVIKVRLI